MPALKAETKREAAGVAYWGVEDFAPRISGCSISAQLRLATFKTLEAGFWWAKWAIRSGTCSESSRTRTSKSAKKINWYSRAQRVMYLRCGVRSAQALGQFLSPIMGM